jgi:hypothetical protein
VPGGASHALTRGARANTHDHNIYTTGVLWKAGAAAGGGASNVKSNFSSMLVAAAEAAIAGAGGAGSGATRISQKSL